MLLLSTKLQQLPIMSLQTGARIAQINGLIIDPGTLDIIAYKVFDNKLEPGNWLLLTDDIREVSDLGLIIDSIDELVLEEDMVKLKDLIKLDFQLYDMVVIDDQKTKLGKIYDFSIDPIQFRIHQLHVKRPLMKSLQTSELLINRTQIVEVNNKNIIVSSASLDEKTQPAAVEKNFVNPFRKNIPPAEQTPMKR